MNKYLFFYYLIKLKLIDNVNLEESYRYFLRNKKYPQCELLEKNL
jgi:RNase P/RNase MRP subunit p30